MRYYLSRTTLGSHESANAMHTEGIERIVVLQSGFQYCHDQEADGTCNQTDQNRAEGFDKTGVLGYRRKACNRSGKWHPVRWLCCSDQRGKTADDVHHCTACEIEYRANRW